MTWGVVVEVWVLFCVCFVGCGVVVNVLYWGFCVFVALVWLCFGW